MSAMDLKDIVKELKEYDGPQVRLMEVCGTHTAAISENGIPSGMSCLCNRYGSDRPAC